MKWADGVKLAKFKGKKKKKKNCLKFDFHEF